MKLLIGLLLALLGAVALTLVVYEDNGYVLIGYGYWTVQGSLALFVVLDLVAFLLLYLGVRTLAHVWRLPAKVHEWNERRAVLRARTALTRGLMHLAEGEWRAAEKSLVRFAAHSETPLLNYLAAARAAQAQGAHERRDHYLQRAHQSMPSADVAVSLTQAELQLAHQQLEQALATLMHLRTVAPHHAYVLKLLKTLYMRLGDWQALRDLLPELRRRKVESEERLRDLELEVYRALIAQEARDADPGRLERFWAELAKPLRSDESLLKAYVCAEIDRGRARQAEPVLREHLRKHWSEPLIAILGVIETDEPGRQLGVAEVWLQAHPTNSVLLLALGRLCLRDRLWGKARGYLEASVGAGPRPETYRELGALLEQLGENDKARESYRAGLELGTAGAAPSPAKVPRLLGTSLAAAHSAPPVEAFVRTGYSA